MHSHASVGIHSTHSQGDLDLERERLSLKCLAWLCVCVCACARLKARQRVDFDLSCRCQMIHLRPRHQRRRKKKKKKRIRDHRNKVRAKLKLIHHHSENLLGGMWFDFRVIGATSILLTLCMSEHTKPERKTACPVFFTVQEASLFEIFLSTLFEWREKRRPKEATRVTGRHRGGVLAPKRNARPRPHCVTHRARAINISLVTNIPQTIFFFSLVFFSSKILDLLTSLKKKGFRNVPSTPQSTFPGKTLGIFWFWRSNEVFFSYFLPSKLNEECFPANLIK